MIRICFLTIALLSASVMQAQLLPKVSIHNRTDKAGGVVITNANGEMVGYTDRGSAETAMDSKVFREIVSCIEASDEIVSTGRARARAVRAPRMARTAPTPGNKSVGPLLKNLWSQYEAPYDWMTPKIDGKPCEAGCVALAMAQVMHYWQWPEHGYGSYTYTDVEGCGQTLTVDFDNHYYDWDNMLGNYEGVQYTDAQGFAVAQLLYDCGVSVDMIYGVDASGARVVKQPIAMVRNFGYDSSCQLHFRDFYSLDEWTQMFYDELDAGRPILMSGLSQHYNHAFVCDGYDERGFFHFSFGNVNGAADGFFYLPYLTPDIPPEMRPEEAEGGFNLLQSMTTRIMPFNHEEATGVENHLFAMSRMSVIGDDTCVVRSLSNIGWNIHNDSVALALLHNDEIAAIPYTYIRDFKLEEVDDTTYTDTISFSAPLSAFGVSAPDGTYKLMPMFRDNGEWKAVKTSLGIPNYLIANVRDNRVSLHADTVNTAYLTLDSFDFPDWVKTRCTPDHSYTITCHNADFCGRVYVMLVNVVDTLPSFLIQDQGLTLSAGETTTLRFYHTSHLLLTGNYNLIIFYDNDLLSTDVVDFEDVHKSVIVSDSQPSTIESPQDDPRTVLADRQEHSLSGIRLHTSSPHRGIIVKGGVKILRK